MAIAKLNLLEIEFPQEQDDAVLMKLVNLDNFHPEYASKFADSVQGLSVLNRENPYADLIGRMEEAKEKYQIDLKCIDEDLHIKITGHSNKNVLEMFKYLDERNIPISIRHVLVPTLTDNDELLKRTSDFISSLHNVKRVEILPYHTLGVFKYEKLGINYPLKGVDTPNDECIENAKKILKVDTYNGYLN